MSLYGRYLEGENVEISWNNPDYDWPTFHVMRVWPNRRIMRLKGIDDRENGGVHGGDDFIALFEEIKYMEVME